MKWTREEVVELLEVDVFLITRIQEKFFKLYRGMKTFDYFDEKYPHDIKSSGLVVIMLELFNDNGKIPFDISDIVSKYSLRSHVGFVLSDWYNVSYTPAKRMMIKHIMKECESVDDVVFNHYECMTFDEVSSYVGVGADWMRTHVYRYTQVNPVNLKDWFDGDFSKPTKLTIAFVLVGHMLDTNTRPDSIYYFLERFNLWESVSEAIDHHITFKEPNGKEQMMNDLKRVKDE